MGYMGRNSKAKKRSYCEIRDGIQSTLESRKKFCCDYIPFGKKWSVPDGNFKYRRKFPESLATGFWRTVLFLFSPILLKVWFGAKVTGRENLKELKNRGALCVCNHIDYLDTLFVRQAVGHFRSYHTISQQNNKGGALGHIMRHGGTLPFSQNYTAMKNMTAEMERLLKRGKIINFYPEKAMWPAYQKPRPMQDGAFYYAVKFGVPVIPVFCTFEKRKNGSIKRLRINILKPVYADESLQKRQRIRQMKRIAEALWKTQYERAYNKKLEYITLPSLPAQEKEVL